LLREIINADPVMIQVELPSGDSPLHTAVQCSAIDKAEFLLTRGADVNARANEGTTPLHLAVHDADLPMMSLLLRHGADVNLTDDYDKSALARVAQHYMKCSGDDGPDQAAFEMLKSAGATYDLMSASYQCDLPRITEILNEDPDAARKLCPIGSEFALYGALVSDWQGRDIKLQILDILFMHGLNIPRERLISMNDSREWWPDFEEDIRQIVRDLPT
jgi:hypothetical protein